ncbi:MAG: hypothetical protein A2Y03_08780 [Omnitrophica WOR_2 bacterium GWF2_38_59]|nr:MAG: hypothetical protein A2Y03_08780 [Omnitrophica WOR_2 bacterium GWF2_38_59]OGX46717.1 MAG: hypothetical protein A2243_02410 [Omnitrophica WOR_2 bacterium RIFOXYA2_FULL_38_17]OGX53201.1 MAG: hypothetical protein A2267_06410 [Omnitrophica WOR_2 bacterium RIFOXYA12_FULL_38_10]OGX56588.1 MAG: hypothetical protein A2447_07085 [Omnitrophica WOR_2 bacterium RIFOXYC2_FULL_38_12]OGX59807.1 MAG: hypothetical protein A2306_05935 [Omnitrophica WOR_2 bacterium RIFOXYB2_FULL_38_16]HBG62134.1 hypothet
MYWIQFFISAVFIVLAGIRLTEYADKLSEQSNIGKAWIGIILLGLVTSLPEAIVSLTSVISLKANNMAIGNLLGSNNFNPMLIVLMDAFYRKGSMTNDIARNKSHDISASFAVILTLVVIGEIFLGKNGFSFRASFVSFGSILIAVLYFAGMWYLSKADSDQIKLYKKDPIKAQDCTVSALEIWTNLTVSAVIVVLAAMWLAQSADVIADRTGLGRTFVGSIFLAVVTSLPEMVVSLSALRLGAFDMAIGNIFGSNMTNLFVVFLCDLFYKGAILTSVDPVHILTASSSIVLVLISCVGMKIKHKRGLFGLGWDSVLMILIFVAVNILLYRFR